MPEYKNITNKTLGLPGIGVVGPYESINAPEGFNNANFVKVGEVPAKKIRRKKKKHAILSR